LLLLPQDGENLPPSPPLPAKEAPDSSPYTQDIFSFNLIISYYYLKSGEFFSEENTFYTEKACFFKKKIHKIGNQKLTTE